MELAAPSLVGGVEREGAQIAAHGAVMGTENATVVAATKSTQAAVAANLAAKASAANERQQGLWKCSWQNKRLFARQRPLLHVSGHKRTCYNGLWSATHGYHHLTSFC
eukprot:7384381-Prymnesium_polylepis.1